MTIRREARVQRNNGERRLFPFHASEVFQQQQAVPDPLLDISSRKSPFTFISYIVFLIFKIVKQVSFIVMFCLINFNLFLLAYFHIFIFSSKLTIILRTEYLIISMRLNQSAWNVKKSWIVHANWHNRGNLFRVLTVMETPLFHVAQGAASTAC